MYGHVYVCTSYTLSQLGDRPLIHLILEYVQALSFFPRYEDMPSHTVDVQLRFADRRTTFLGRLTERTKGKKTKRTK